MDIYFAGAENQIYLRHLDELGVTHIAISFYEWQRRHSTDDLYKHVPRNMQVCITAGIARKESIDFDAFATDYLEFCERNADQCLIYDMDAPFCPPELRATVQQQLSILPNVVVFPTEHQDLISLSREYERLGVNARLAKSSSGAELRRIPASLYGSNVADYRTLRIGRFTATTTLAWLSGRRYGEFWVFARNKMHHYPAEKLKRAVRAHKADVEAFGVDPAACAANDHDALTEVAVRSFQALAASLSKRPRDRKTGEIAGISHSEGAENGVEGGANTGTALLSGNGAMVPTERERFTLPVISMKDQDGTAKVESTNVSLRSCDSCNLSDVCPAYTAESSCAFSIPVEIKTDAQWEAACQSLLEMQFQRAAFGHFAEQVEGGVINPRVGQEMDRFYKMLGQVKDLKTPTPAPGGGVLGRVFGTAPVPEPAGELEQRHHDDAEEVEIIENYEEVFEDQFGEAEWVDPRAASEDEGSRSEDFEEADPASGPIEDAELL